MSSSQHFLNNNIQCEESRQNKICIELFKFLFQTLLSSKGNTEIFHKNSTQFNILYVLISFIELMAYHFI